MINKTLKYFCKKCGTTKHTFIASIQLDPTEKKMTDIEVIKTFEQTIDGEKKEFKARKLECQHWVSFFTPAFSENSNPDILDEIETIEIRKKINEQMIGKTEAEVQQTILFHAEQYSTLLKIATKQRQQAKYAIMFLDELKEKFKEQLSDDTVRLNFERKFALFCNSSNNSSPRLAEKIEREKKQEMSTVDKQKSAIEKMQAELMNSLRKHGKEIKDFSK